MSEPAPQAMSVDEYLRTEQESPVKREYVGGFVYPLHGATRAQAGAHGNHVQIVANIIYALTPAVRQLGCRLYPSDMKLRTGTGRKNFFYPDVMVACTPSRADPYFETDPCLLIEVLSSSTAVNDRREKYAVYTAIPGLQTYLIVHQDERRVEAYSRHSSDWNMQELVNEGSIALPCLGSILRLDEMYIGVPGL